MRITSDYHILMISGACLNNDFGTDRFTKTMNSADMNAEIHICEKTAFREPAVEKEPTPHRNIVEYASG